MRRYQRIRKNIQKLISVNPTYITVTRKTGVTDGAGGYTYSTTELNPIKVRLHGRKVMTVVSNDGGKFDSIRAKLMCDWCANLKRYNQLNEDTFLIGTDKYRVLDLKEFWEDGFTVSKEAEVEIID